MCPASASSASDPLSHGADDLDDEHRADDADARSASRLRLARVAVVVTHGPCFYGRALARRQTAAR